MQNKTSYVPKDRPPANIYDDGNIPEVDLPKDSISVQPKVDLPIDSSPVQPAEPLPESTRPRKDGPGGS